MAKGDLTPEQEAFFERRIKRFRWTCLAVGAPVGLVLGFVLPDRHYWLWVLAIAFISLMLGQPIWKAVWRKMVRDMPARPKDDHASPPPTKED